MEKIKEKISELKALYDEHFKYRYITPKTNTGETTKAVALALAKERKEFIEFLESIEPADFAGIK